MKVCDFMKHLLLQRSKAYLKVTHLCSACTQIKKEETALAKTTFLLCYLRETGEIQTDSHQ